MNQRQIKFRVWDKKAQKMRLVDNITFQHPALGDVAIAMWDGDKKLNQTLTCSLSTAMQFTGLYDKNGKEIWEGDVVKHSDSDFERDCFCDDIEWDDDCLGSDKCNRINEVIEKYGALCVAEYNNDIGGFIFPSPLQELRNLEDSCFAEGRFCYLEHFKYAEVIGNVYENPELVGDVG